MFHKYALLLTDLKMIPSSSGDSDPDDGPEYVKDSEGNRLRFIIDGEYYSAIQEQPFSPTLCKVKQELREL